MSSASKATYPRAVVVPVLVIALIALVAMFWRPGGGPSVGDRLPGGHVIGDSENSYAQMPYGSLQITMTKDRTARVDGSERELDGDAEWVEVSWNPVIPPGSAQVAVWPETTAKKLQEPASRIILRGDGDDRVIADQVTSTDGKGSVALAVEDPSDLAVLVSTAGGPARPTEPKPTPTGLRSGTPDPSACTDRSSSRTGFSYDVGCSFDATRAAYVAGLGQAPSGKDWLVVRDVRVQKPYGVGKPMRVGRWSTEEHSVDYVASGQPSLRLEVSGAGQPAKTVGRDTRTTSDPRLATRAFLVPQDKPATVTMSYRTAAVPAPDEDAVAGAPAKKTVSVRATVPLPG